MRKQVKLDKVSTKKLFFMHLPSKKTLALLLTIYPKNNFLRSLRRPRRRILRVQSPQEAAARAFLG
jgi:hypothetical protein